MAGEGIVKLGDYGITRQTYRVCSYSLNNMLIVCAGMCYTYDGLLCIAQLVDVC